VAHWKLDETEGMTAHDATGAHNGTLNGNPTWLPTGGMIGGALQFNGTNAYIQTAHIPFNNQSFTIAMWANPMLLSGEQTILSETQSRSENRSLHLRLGGPGAENAPPPGGVRMAFYANDLDTPAGIIENNRWYHLTFEYDYADRVRRIYVDGEQMAEGAGVAPFAGTTGDTIIGSWDGTDQWFNGVLDDIRLYDQALCQKEILAVMGGLDIVLPIESEDIGASGAGSNSYKNGVHTILGGGLNAVAGCDDLRYVYVPVTGDFEVSAHVLSLQKTSDWSKAGVMIRETLDPDGRNAFMCITPASGQGRFVFQTRSGQPGEPSVSLQTAQGQVSLPSNTWLKITRRGNDLTGLVSQDGLFWQKLPGPYPAEPAGGANPVTIEMPETIYVGLAVTANHTRSLCKAEFDSLLISLGVSTAEESEGPVAHWTFDETSGGVAVDSAGYCDGLLVGEPIWQPSGGKVGGALKFDGSNDCVMTASVLNPADGPLSVFAWVQGGAGRQVIISQDGSVGGTDWLGASLAGRLTSALCSPALTSSKVITDDQWHEVGVTWDGTSRTLYVDGATVATDKPAPPASSTGGLNIGTGKNLDAGTFWSGLIDDVRIYNYAAKR